MFSSVMLMERRKSLHTRSNSAGVKPCSMARLSWNTNADMACIQLSSLKLAWADRAFLVMDKE